MSAAAQPAGAPRGRADDGRRPRREFVDASALPREASTAGRSVHAPLPVGAPGAGIGAGRTKTVPRKAERATTRSQR